jgi:hypothetical protein
LDPFEKFDKLPFRVEKATMKESSKQTTAVVVLEDDMPKEMRKNTMEFIVTAMTKYHKNRNQVMM